MVHPKDAAWSQSCMGHTSPSAVFPLLPVLATWLSLCAWDAARGCTCCFRPLPVSWKPRRCPVARGGIVALNTGLLGPRPTPSHLRCPSLSCQYCSACPPCVLSVLLQWRVHRTPSPPLGWSLPLLSAPGACTCGARAVTLCSGMWVLAPFPGLCLLSRLPLSLVQLWPC